MAKIKSTYRGQAVFVDDTNDPPADPTEIITNMGEDGGDVLAEAAYNIARTGLAECTDIAAAEAAAAAAVAAIAAMGDVVGSDVADFATAAQGALADTALQPGGSPQFTAVNLGHASDTTITRVSAGVVAVEGATVILSGAALGTPSSGTLTSCTGLPISTGVSGLGTSVATALAVNIGSAGSVLRNTDIASGTITARADDLDLSGGNLGDVLTVQSNGSLAVSTKNPVVTSLTGATNLASTHNTTWLECSGTFTLTIRANANEAYPANFVCEGVVNSGTLTIAGENSGGAPLINGSASTSVVLSPGQAFQLVKLEDDVWRLSYSELTSKSVTVTDPTNAEDISLFRANQAYAIVKMVAVLIGSSTPSVTWTVRKNSDRSATGTEVVTSGTTTTSTTTGSVVTTLNSAGIAADDFVWLETTAKSGTVDEYHLTIFMVPA